MDVRKLKEGDVKRYKTGLLSNKWKDSYAVLFSDSTLAIYDKKGDSRSVEQFLLKDVAPYTCVGLMCDRMPVQRPTLPTGSSVHHLVGFGMDPRANKVVWLLFSSDADLEGWFNEITKTLPKVNASAPPSGPPQPPPQAGPGGVPSAAPPNSANTYVPPSQYPPAPGVYRPQPNPAQPPPMYANNVGPQPQPGAGTQPYYGPPTSTHTVVIERDRPYSSGFGGSSGLGLGSGLLMGSLLGYGIGSFFTPHYYSPGFGGFGMGGGFGHGFGGGYPIGGGGYSSVQDNDTYVTNNYYNTNNDGDTTDQHQQSQDDSGGNYNDNYDDQQQDDYDAGGYDDYDAGGDFDVGDMGGGGDFDGGDW